MGSRAAAVLHDERDVVPLAPKGDSPAEYGLELRGLVGAGLTPGILLSAVFQRRVGEDGRTGDADEEVLAAAV